MNSLKNKKYTLRIKYYSILKEECGGYGEMDTPVPISNTEVKHFSADDSWVFPAKIGRCQALFLILFYTIASVAQLVRAHDC